MVDKKERREVPELLRIGICDDERAARDSLRFQLEKVSGGQRWGDCL